jgi:hypothetical protein
MVVDRVASDEMASVIADFCQQLHGYYPQHGYIILASEEKLTVTEKLTIKHCQYLDVQQMESKFDGATSYRLLESLLKPIYKSDAETYWTKFWKNAPIYQRWNPNYPHKDKQLKTQLVKLLNYCPQAIYAASMYIQAEYKSTGEKPSTLLARYIKKLMLHLGEHRSAFVEQKSDSSSKKKAIAYRQHVCEQVYHIAFKRLNELSEAGSNVANLAFQLLPLCLTLEPKHLHLTYFYAYASYYQPKKSESEINAAITLLTDYFLLKPYFPQEVDQKSQYHTVFQVHSSLKDAYLTFEAKRQNSEDKSFADAKKQIGEEVRQKVGRWMQAAFHLKNDYIKMTGSDWQYIGHCLYWLSNAEEDFNSNPQALVKELKTINPVLNMLVQMGKITEMEVLTSMLNKKLQEALSGWHIVAPQLVFKAHYNSDYLNKPDPNYHQKIASFCQELYNKDPHLPVYYTQLLYYHARWALKAELPQPAKAQAFQDLRFAIEMRKVIAFTKSENLAWQYPIDKTMAYEVNKFQRDGLGVFYLQENTPTHLNQAKELFERLKQTDSSYVNIIHCNQYLADIERRLVVYALENNQTCPASEQRIQNAMDLLAENASLEKKLTVNERSYSYAKTERNIFITAQLEGLQAKQQLLARKHETGSLEKALDDCDSFLRQCNDDQGNDRAEAFALLGELHTYAVSHFFQNTDKRSLDQAMHHADKAEEALLDSLALQETIKINPDDKAYLNTKINLVTVHLQRTQYYFSDSPLDKRMPRALQRLQQDLATFQKNELPASQAKQVKVLTEQFQELNEQYDQAQKVREQHMLASASI